MMTIKYNKIKKLSAGLRILLIITLILSLSTINHSNAVNFISVSKQASLNEWQNVSGQTLTDSNGNVSNNNGNSFDPNLVLDSSGNPCIVWDDNTTGKYEIYFARWNGTNWVNIQGNLLNATNGIIGINFDVVSASLSISIDSRDNPCIAIMKYAGYSTTYCYFTKWNGTNWVNAQGTLFNTTNGFICKNDGQVGRLSLSLDTNGYPCLSWNTESDFWMFLNDISPDIYYAKWNGTNWVNVSGAVLTSTNSNVSNNDGNSYDPNLVLDSSDNPCIAWDDGTSGNYEIYYAKWNGTNWVNAQGAILNSTNGNMSNSSVASSEPSLVLDSSGNPCIAWEDRTPNNWEIYYAKWNGTNWVNAQGAILNSTNGNISNNSGYSLYPSLELDSSGYPYIAWNDGTSGNGEIYYAKWNGTNWVNAQGAILNSTNGNMSNSSVASSEPSLVLDSSGNPCIAWIEYTPGSPEIYYAKWSNAQSAVLKTNPSNPINDFLSPVIGSLRITSTNKGIGDGLWEFNQHKTGNHILGGGLYQADDTYAWDINLYEKNNSNADKGKDVYAIEDGEIVKFANLMPPDGLASDGISYGAVMIAHPNKTNPKYYSAYIHLENIPSLKEGDFVNQSTIIGKAGKAHTTNEHLHLVLYQAKSNQINQLKSFNCTKILERTSNPSYLAQYMCDKTTTIPFGGTTKNSFVYLASIVEDKFKDSKVEFECVKNGVNFSGVANCPASFNLPNPLFKASGVTLKEQTEYIWRARIVTKTNARSAWVSPSGYSTVANKQPQNTNNLIGVNSKNKPYIPNKTNQTFAPSKCDIKYLKNNVYVYGDGNDPTNNHYPFESFKKVIPYDVTFINLLPINPVLPPMVRLSGGYYYYNLDKGSMSGGFVGMTNIPGETKLSGEFSFKHRARSVGKARIVVEANTTPIDLSLDIVKFRPGSYSKHYVKAIDHNEEMYLFKAGFKELLKLGTTVILFALKNYVNLAKLVKIGSLTIKNAQILTKLYDVYKNLKDIIKKKDLFFDAVQILSHVSSDPFYDESRQLPDAKETLFSWDTYFAKVGEEYKLDLGVEYCLKDMITASIDWNHLWSKFRVTVIELEETNDEYSNFWFPEENYITNTLFILGKYQNSSVLMNKEYQLFLQLPQFAKEDNQFTEMFSYPVGADRTSHEIIPFVEDIKKWIGLKPPDWLSKISKIPDRTKKTKLCYQKATEYSKDSWVLEGNSKIQFNILAPYILHIYSLVGGESGSRRYINKFVVNPVMDYYELKYRPKVLPFTKIQLFTNKPCPASGDLTVNATNNQEIRTYSPQAKSVKLMYFMPGDHSSPYLADMTKDKDNPGWWSVNISMNTKGKYAMLTSAYYEYSDYVVYSYDYTLWGDTQVIQVN